MIDIESVPRALHFEFDREYVGRPNERWTMYGKSIDHVAVGTPDSFAELARVLSGAADNFDGLTFSASRIGDGDTLLTMMRGARVMVPRAAGASIARTIDMLIYDGFQVCMDRHKRTLESFAALARVFEQALLMQAYGDMREERGICRAYSTDGFEVSQRVALQVDRSRTEDGE